MGHRKLLLQKNILYLLIVGQGKIDHQVFKVALLSYLIMLGRNNFPLASQLILRSPPQSLRNRDVTQRLSNNQIPRGRFL